MALFRFKSRCKTHTTPLRLIELAITIFVETPQLPSIIFLPFPYDLTQGSRQIAALPTASCRPKITNGIQRLVGVQTFFCIAILAMPR